MGLLERIAAGRVETRNSIDQWLTDYLIPSFSYNGVFYSAGQSGLVQTLAGNRASEISATLPSYVAAVRQTPPAFAAQMVRALVLSQARFRFRNRATSNTPKRMFGTSALSILERPWPNGTTGELVSRMEWHAGLAGNAYIAYQPARRGRPERLRVLRPDWCALVYGSDQEPEDAAYALDGDLIGLVYQNGGIGSSGNRPQTLLVGEFAHWCADEETQILTAEGWKDFSTLREGDEVLTLNHETGMSEWQPVIEVCVFPAQRREMVLMEGNEFSSLTTLNHRWPVEYKNSRGRRYDRRWVTSATIGAGDRIPVAAMCADTPKVAKWSDALVEATAWFWTEGRFKSGSPRGTKGRGIQIAQSLKNASNLARIRAALTVLFGPAVQTLPRKGPRKEVAATWRESIDDDMVIFSLTANASDAITCHAPSKIVKTEFLRSLTQSQLELFINVSMLADNGGKNKLAQKVPAMAEQFALACLLAGDGVSIRDGASKLRDYRMTKVARLRKRHVYPQESQRPGTRFKVQRVTYDGQVWCPRTPNQTWLARRRGSVYFTGNSPMPDPLHAGIGMSWLTPAIRDLQADQLATQHKIKFFENGATPSLVVKGLASQTGQPLTKDQFDSLVDMMEGRHAGVANAYRTLYLTAGADATVVGSDLKQIDFRATVGAGETRIAVLSRVPAPLLGISEGLAGSSLNAGNFGMARRMFADTWVYPNLQDLAASLAAIVKVPGDAELWFDVGDMPILREDAKDAADITFTQMQALEAGVRAGYEPSTLADAVVTNDLSKLRHSGMVSVQLQKPGASPDSTPPDSAPAGAES